MWEYRKGEKYEPFKNVSTIYKRRGWNGNRRGDSDHRGKQGREFGMCLMLNNCREK